MSRKRRPYLLCMVNHPERGRHPERIHRDIRNVVYTNAWVPNDGHPLGGYEGVVILKRRVNLVKDVLPGWYHNVRPLYEFTKEQK